MPTPTYKGALTSTGDFALNSTGNAEIFDRGQSAQEIRTRFTVAQVNAGATLLAAIPGYKYRLVDIALIAIGGNAATATAVTISGTQSTSVVALISAAVAALTRSAWVKPNTANVTILADGASFVSNDANTAITIEKTGGTLATATHIDVIASYVIEQA